MTTEQSIRNEIEECKKWKYWSLNKKRYFVINSEMMNEEIINRFNDDEFENLFDKGVEIRIDGLNNKLSGYLLAQSEAQTDLKKKVENLTDTKPQLGCGPQSCTFQSGQIRGWKDAMKFIKENTKQIFNLETKKEGEE